MKILMNMIAQISNFIPKNTRIKFTQRLINMTLDRYANIEIVGKEIIDARKGLPTIYIGNHLSNIDGVILNRYLRNNDVSFMAGVKLSKNKITNLVLETVNTIPITPNTADKRAIKRAVNKLKSGGSIFIFPEGTRSRSASLIKAKKGFILLAKMAKCQLVPVALEGTEKLLPINDENMGKEKFHHADVKLTFGKPFTLPEKTEYNKENWTEYATKYSMNKIAELLSPRYQGVYKVEK